MAGSAQPLGAESGVRQYQLFINGKFVDSRSGKRFESISPHDRSVVAVFAEGDKADIDAAVGAARAAYEGTWSSTPAGERARVLGRIADLLEANAADLGRLETLDMGMPILMTGGMGPLAAEVFRYWAGMATKLHGLTSPALRPGDFLGYTLREPVGVVGGITPWNAPLLMATWKTAPALACGNTVVLKPAEHTPMTSLELARLTAEAGLPEGVLNVVPGFGPTAGAALASHPGVDKIAFTGEYVTGRLIVQMSATNLKTVTLELGEVAPHHLRRRGPRDGGHQRPLRHLHEHRPDLLGRDPHPGAGHHVRALRRALRGALGADQDRRPARLRDPHGAARLRGAAAEGPALRRDRQEGGREPPLRRRAAEGSRARQGLLLRAHRVHRGRQQDADRPGGDLRPGGQ